MKRLALLIALTACSPGLKVDDSVIVSCTTNDDCPAPLVCLNGQRCVNPQSVDQNGVSPAFPTKDAVLSSSSDVTFAWGGITHAGSYRLEIATDADFTSYVAGTPVQTAANGFVTHLDVGTYYWRVTSDITAPAIPAQSVRFSVLGDTVFVGCFTTDDNCEPRADVSELGTPEAPFRSIARATTTALGLGITKLSIATRPGGLAYPEALKLFSGFTLSGGYSQDFATQSRRSAIAFNGVALYALFIDQPTTVEHLSFANTTTNASTSSTAARMIGCTQALTLSDVGFTGATVIDTIVDVEQGADTTGPLITDSELSGSCDGSGLGVGLNVVNASLRIKNTTMALTQSGVAVASTVVNAEQSTISFDTVMVAVHGQSFTAVGITSNASSLDAIDTTIVMDVDGLANGIDADGGTVQLHGCTIDTTTNNGIGFSVGTRLDLLSLTDSRIRVRSAVESARGVTCDSVDSLYMANNTIAVDAAAGDAEALTLQNSVGVIVNNTLIVGRGVQAEHAIAVTDSSVRLINNALVSVGGICGSACRYGVHEVFYRPTVSGGHEQRVRWLSE